LPSLRELDLLNDTNDVEEWSLELPAINDDPLDLFSPFFDVGKTVDSLWGTTDSKKGRPEDITGPQAGSIDDARFPPETDARDAPESLQDTTKRSLPGGEKFISAKDTPEALGLGVGLAFDKSEQKRQPSTTGAKDQLSIQSQLKIGSGLKYEPSHRRLGKRAAYPDHPKVSSPPRSNFPKETENQQIPSQDTTENYYLAGRIPRRQDAGSTIE
jgi:hypothetical protein